MASLNHSLKTNEQFIYTINQFITKHISKQPEEEHIETFEVSETEIVDAEIVVPVIEQRPSIQKLWQAILDTETEALPSITASEALQKTENGGCYIPYDGEISPLDQFKRDEVVEAIGKVKMEKKPLNMAK